VDGLRGLVDVRMVGSGVVILHFNTVVGLAPLVFCTPWGGWGDAHGGVNFVVVEVRGGDRIIVRHGRLVG